jgi:hypothetical protein
MPEHVIDQGDCVFSLSYENGLFWRTVWNHPTNSELRRLRPDPSILYPGDVLFIPERTLKIVSAATDQRHSYIRKGVPAKLRLRLMGERQPEDQGAAAQSEAEVTETGYAEASIEYPAGQTSQRRDEPLANVPYRIQIDDQRTEGQTDGEGRIEVSIPPNAREATLTLHPGTEQQRVIPLQLGHLDPLDTVPGVKARLGNLGFECGDREEEETPQYAAALSAYQEKHGLQATGILDAATRDALQSTHGS